ncbi:MAG: hypothetical protein DI556_18225 [Rhodovulum sulfidophilum]|uniref:Uncharacterized protein n=1 Tax=Rhodovulum sulfidophilum TaxID=35806 RepID=A0A2W5N253_RHOSU|nr:MAG: hypothetical protein DI556_18225 [Rhodovulum sulfidophilum]
MSRGNLGRIGLRRRPARGDAMADYDRLPEPARRWLAAAVLPWSPRSAGRAYAAALARHGEVVAAVAALDRLEAARLAAARPGAARAGTGAVSGGSRRAPSAPTP